MTSRRSILALVILGGTALLAPLDARLAAADSASAANAEAIGAALLNKYVAAVNAHDTSSFPELFTESYIQHSGRSPSGLAAQVENFRRVFAATPDHRMQVEDRIIAGDKIVARSTHSATHTQTFRGFAPTGKPFTYTTIDIWRVENGKLAEHWDLTDAVEVLRQLRAD
jgi:predicted ester cyclase